MPPGTSSLATDPLHDLSRFGSHVVVAAILEDKNTNAIGSKSSDKQNVAFWKVSYQVIVEILFAPTLENDLKQSWSKLTARIRTKSREVCG